MPPTFAESTVFIKQISVSKLTLFAMIGPGGDKIPTCLWVTLDGIVGVQVAFLSGTKASDVLKNTIWF